MASREARIWSGRPSMRPLFLNPAYIAAWAFALFFLRLYLTGAPLPFRVPNLIPSAGFDVRLAAAAMLGAPLLWWPLTVLTTRFILTNERLFVARGILGRTLDEIELYRVRDVRLTKGFLQRLAGLGTVHVWSSDGTVTLVLPSIVDSTRVREGIREAAEATKRARGVTIAS